MLHNSARGACMLSTCTTSPGTPHSKQELRQLHDLRQRWSFTFRVHRAAIDTSPSWTIAENMEAFFAPKGGEGNDTVCDGRAATRPPAKDEKDLVVQLVLSLVIGVSALIAFSVR